MTDSETPETPVKPSVLRKHQNILIMLATILVQFSLVAYALNGHASWWITGASALLSVGYFAWAARALIGLGKKS